MAALHPLERARCLQATLGGSSFQRCYGLDLIERSRGFKPPGCSEMQGQLGGLVCFAIWVGPAHRWAGCCVGNGQALTMQGGRKHR